VVSWFSRWQPWKVVCVCNSTSSDVVVVMTLLFGRVDSEEWKVGDP
jgi:hypothetical protein